MPLLVIPIDLVNVEAALAPMNKSAQDADFSCTLYISHLRLNGKCQSNWLKSYFFHDLINS